MIHNDQPIWQLTVEELKQIIHESLPVPKQEVIPDLYGIVTVCKVTGYSKSTIYKKVNNREIPYLKRDGRLLFEKAVIDAWLVENRIPAKELADLI